LVNIEKISENVFAATDGSIHGNVSALILPTKIAIIDTAYDIELMKEFKEKIEEITQKKVKLVFLTHHHSDHTRGLPLFSDCKIYSSKTLYKKIKNRKPLKGYENTLPNELFENYLELKEDNVKIILKETKGHTTDSTYIYCPDYKVLCAGDNLFINRYPYGGATADPQIWEDTINEYLTIDADFYVPGHGPVVDKNGVEAFRDLLHDLNNIFKEKIVNGESEDKVKEAAKEIGSFDHMRAQEITIGSFYKYWLKKLHKK
jgi:glyoxylase-like metal-dependent hydrolase (beta-lactamase superfamily II)